MQQSIYEVKEESSIDNLSINNQSASYNLELLNKSEFIIPKEQKIKEYMSVADKLLINIENDEWLKPFELKNKESILAAYHYASSKMKLENNNSYMLLFNLINFISEQYNSYLDLLINKDYLGSDLDEQKYQQLLNQYMINSEISVGKLHNQTAFSSQLISYVQNTVGLWSNHKNKKIYDEPKFIIQDIINGTRKTIVTIDLNSIKDMQIYFDKCQKSVRIIIRDIYSIDYIMVFKNINLDIFQMEVNYEN